jgi:tetratricopeptide (TPR) repeat protein
VAFDTTARKEKAKLAVERRNYAGAIEIYQEILQIVPDDVEARKALRAVEVRQTKEAGTGRVGAILKNLGTYIKLMLPSKNHEQVMMSCEAYLQSDPTHVGILKKLAGAAMGAGYMETAAAVLEDVRQQNPKDLAGLRMLQATYQQMEDIGKAMEINKAILSVAPGDREANQAIRDLSASDMSAKFQDAAVSGERGKAARGIVKSQDQAERLSRELRTTDDVIAEIEDTIEDIRAKPKDARLYMKVGNLYLRLKKWDDAEEYFDRAVELSPTEYTIKMKVQDVQIGRMRETASKLAKAWKANPKDAATKASYRKSYNELLNYRLECFEEREKQFPTDLGVAFDLANIFFELNRLDDAIKRYQRTMHDPKNRAKSLLNMGIAFQKKEEYDLAIKRYTEGIDGIEIWNEAKMNTIYHRADCYEAMGESEKAAEDFTSIYEKDIGFRDVGKRLERLK